MICTPLFLHYIVSSIPQKLTELAPPQQGNNGGGNGGGGGESREPVNGQVVMEKPGVAGWPLYMYMLL